MSVPSGLPPGTVSSNALPLDFWLPKPYLQVAPDQTEIGTGYTCVALFLLYLLVAVALLVWELRKKAITWKNLDVGIFFLVTGSFYFAVRATEILVSLNLYTVYTNMLVGMILEMIGNSLALLAFTSVVACWSKILGRPEHGTLGAVIRAGYYGIWIMWGVITICLLAFMLWYVGVLGYNWGVSAHDNVYIFPNGVTLVTVPINNTLIKPQTAAIMANNAAHTAYMAEKGMYACYGFTLGLVFMALALAIIIELSQLQSALASDGGKLKAVAFRIMLVSGGVMLCYAVIFIFTVLEITTHRHGLRYEYYITNYLCAELIAFGILLFHFWSANLRESARERDDASESQSTRSWDTGSNKGTASTEMSSGVSSSRHDGSSTHGDEEAVINL